MNGTAMSFENVTKSYGRHDVLSRISLDLKEGEYLGLVGVNGAGKTTLIKCLLDLTMANSGKISIFGKPHNRKASRRELVYLPEKFVPPYYLSGNDFLEYMSELYGVRHDRDAIAELLKILDMDLSALEKPVKQLSKGMSQKLGLCACLLSNRKLFVLDEPMSGLDPRARAYLKRHLLGLKEKGRTLFFSSHMLNDVEVLCDRVAILHEGQILFTGSPKSCCEKFNAESFEQAYLNCVAAGVH